MSQLESAPSFRYAHEQEMSNLRQVAATDEDMKAINKLALKEMTRDDVAIFRLDIVNNAVDRHHSRFPDKSLDTINRLIVKKPLMEKHATRTELPIGRFFQSSIAQSPRDVVSVQPDAYILKIPQNRERIDNIMGGVYWGTSIGFSFDYPECSICNQDLGTCAHMPGFEYDVDRGGKKSREVCHYIMHDVSDVFEGSIVAVPSQRTEVVAARTLPDDCAPNLLTAIAQRRALFNAPIIVNTRTNEAPAPETPAVEPTPQPEPTTDHDAGRFDNAVRRARKLLSTTGFGQ